MQVECIPKILFQTWKTKDIPEKWEKSIKSIKKYAKGFEYILMTDEDNLNFIKNYFPQYLQAFQNFRYPIQRADFIRYALLYTHGGVYMDLDMRLVTSLENIIKSVDWDAHDVALLGSKSYSNAFMISKPKNNFWLHAMDKASQGHPWFAFSKHLQVMYTTGPKMLNGLVNSLKYKVYSLPEEIYPCSVCDTIETCRQKTKGIAMLEGQSWNGIDSFIFNLCKCNSKYVWWTLILFIVLILIIFLF